MRFVSLFAGIGGFDLGLERAGHRCVGQVEIDPYATRVLEKHWPHVPRHGDVRTFRGDEFGPYDLLAGGYPCQPFSVAGNRRGELDERHLWPEVLRIVRHVRPRYVLLENVPGHLSLGFGRVLGDLAESGYDAEWDCIPASSVGAPHQRDRVFILAYPQGERERPGLRESVEAGKRRGRSSDGGRSVTDVAAAAEYRRAVSGHRHESRDAPAPSGEWLRPEPVGSRAARGERVLAYPDCEQVVGTPIAWAERNPWPSEPDVGRVANGVPHRVDRLRTLGNAVVPQVAEWIGRRLAALES